MIKKTITNSIPYYFFIAVLLFILSSCKCYEKNIQEDCKEKNINNYLQLQISTNKDTLLFGDTVVLNLCFTNKTDTLLKIYPKANMNLCNIECDRHFDPPGKFLSIPLNNEIDLKNIVELKPNGTFIFEYPIVIQNKQFVFFERGNFEMYIMYWYGKNTDYKDAFTDLSKIKFCNGLRTNSIKIKIE